MSPYIIPGLPTKPTIDTIVAENIAKAVCRYFGIARDVVNKRNRKYEIVLCRQISMYFIKKETLLSLQSIAKMFSPATTDHTTAIHGITQVKNQLSLPVMNRCKEIVEDIINKNLLSYEKSNTFYRGV